MLRGHGNAIRLAAFVAVGVVVVACSGAIDDSSSGASRQGATAGASDPASSQPSGGDACQPIAVCTYVDHLAPDGGGGPGGAIQPKTECRTEHTTPSLFCEWIEGESSMQCRCAVEQDDIPDADAPRPATIMNVAQSTAPDATRTLDLWKLHCAGSCVP